MNLSEAGSSRFYKGTTSKARQNCCSSILNINKSKSNADTENWESDTVTHTEGEGRNSVAETTPE